MFLLTTFELRVVKDAVPPSPDFSTTEHEERDFERAWGYGLF
jgi:hypothetical protein